MSKILITLLIIFFITIIATITYILYRRYKNQNTSPAPAPITPIYCAIPNGTWTQTCTGGTMNGSILTAQCTNSNNTEQPATIDLSQCAIGNISNNNGVLSCVSGTGFCQAQPSCSIPTGTYNSTCTSPSISGTTLSAQCNLPSGSSQLSTLNLHNCGQGDIINNNGQLQCQTGTGLC